MVPCPYPLPIKWCERITIITFYSSVHAAQVATRAPLTQCWVNHDYGIAQKGSYLLNVLKLVFTRVDQICMIVFTYRAETRSWFSRLQKNKPLFQKFPFVSPVAMSNLLNTEYEGFSRALLRLLPKEDLDALVKTATGGRVNTVGREGQMAWFLHNAMKRKRIACITIHFYRQDKGAYLTVVELSNWVDRF